MRKKKRSIIKTVKSLGIKKVKKPLILASGSLIVVLALTGTGYIVFSHFKSVPSNSKGMESIQSGGTSLKVTADGFGTLDWQDTADTQEQQESASPGSQQQPPKPAPVKTPTGYFFPTCTFERIPYATTYENDPNMSAGQQMTIRYGVDGTRTVCTTPNGGKETKSTSEPINKIVKVGTKASSGSGGGGYTYTYAEALGYAQSYCTALGATQNTSAWQPCVQAKLHEYGY